MRTEAVMQALTDDVLKSSEIEGELLDRQQVRSSIARRLGVEIAGLVHSDRQVDGSVEMMLDATQRFEAPLNAERLFAWHASLFPTGRSGMTRILVGSWRDDRTGPMQVISGPIGREKVHFEAPEASRVEAEMRAFIDWFNATDTIDGIIKAALAHLWLVTIHPFEDGNGRTGREVLNYILRRTGFPQIYIPPSEHRFYFYSLTEGNKPNYVPLIDFVIHRMYQSLFYFLTRTGMSVDMFSKEFERYNEATEGKEEYKKFIELSEKFNAAGTLP